MLKDIIGNRQIKEILAFKIQAAKQKNEPLSHILLEGSSGCGKTSTARAIAKELGSSLIEVSGKSIQSLADLHRLFRQIHNSAQYPVILLDEAHALKGELQEVLGLAMETFTLSQGTNENLFKESAVKFSLLACTTVPSQLCRPFRDRFSLALHFQPYSLIDSIEIAKFHAWKNGVFLDDNAALEIAKRAKGIGRMICNYLKNIQDYAVARYNGAKVLTRDIVLKSFNLLDIDDIGLTAIDRKLLNYLHSQNRPVGLQNLTAVLDYDAETICSTLEPPLLAQELISRTPKGRVLTEKGKVHLLTSGYAESESLVAETIDWVIEQRKVAVG